ncbi:MAG: hypothetical protein D6784_11135 [Chloroflexi bacterium]|nr:MAG: hypothetical protein D6784_11135 [Chloroflexota bacterium]
MLTKSRNIFILILVTGLLLVTAAAVSGQGQVAQSDTPTSAFAVSVSGLAFVPVLPDTPYRQDTTRQLLSLTGTEPARFQFTAPLFLPDRSRLVSMTVFGEDFDPQGAVVVRLKRCHHGQPLCTVLAVAHSVDANAAGPFDTGPIPVFSEAQVDNSLYTYLLELELSAMANSGLRSVRLTLENGPPPTPAPVSAWQLSGDTTTFNVPTGGLSRVRICTDDLSHLDNVTHYPRLLVDGRTTTLESNTCVTVWGQDIQIRRGLNAGPSSGTYQIMP